MPERTMAETGKAIIMLKLTSRLIYAFRTFVLGQERPLLFGLVITDKCNLNCFYCESKNSGKYHFTSEHAFSALRDAYNRGHRSLYFTGGEPMLWNDNGYDVSNLVKFARDLGFLDVFIYTNGTFPIDVPGCNYVVTLDGRREIHNKIREGTYDLLINNVRRAVTNSVLASITFNKNNIEYLEDFVREIYALRIFKGIAFNLLTHWPKILDKYGTIGKERIVLLDRIWKLKKNGYPIVLSKSAYIAMRNNNWRRPIPQIELGTKDRVFKCCRDVDNPSICENCGYASCVEVSQILALKPNAMWQILRMVM
jgi:sulfatase maturation enzyme AslB (radical SAM superfamily)